ncbi:MAG: HAD hydrolase family protein [Saprospiraceae bacterium]|nr:HAD hydrolase family protein [Saprospiraceae bacterium]
MLNYLNKFRTIKAFVFDIDGVLTEGTMLLHQDGSLLRSLFVRDGYAMKVAINAGYKIAIISGGNTPTAPERFTSLGLQDVIMQSKDKLSDLNSLKRKYQWDDEEILFMGDDIPDYDAMKSVGMPCCPMDAVDEIRDISLYVSNRKGGQGCARDVIEKVLKLRGDWPGYPNLQISNVT